MNSAFKVVGYFVMLLFVFGFKAFAVHSVVKPLPDSIKFNSLFNTAKRQITVNSLDSAGLTLNTLAQLLTTSSKDLGPTYHLKYLNAQHNFFFKKEMHKEALAIANKMMDLSLKTKSPSQIAEAYFAIALNQSKLGGLATAAVNITKALKIIEPLNRIKDQAKYYFLLSDIFFQLRDGKKSLFYTKKAYQLLQKQGDSTLISSRLNIMLYEILNNQLDLALRHLSEAELNIDKKKDPFHAASIYLYLSHVYYRKKQYDLSLVNLKKAASFLPAVKHNKINLKLHTEMAMAETYFGLKQYAQAKYYFNRNIQRAILEMDANDVRESYLLGSRIYEALGEKEKGFAYLKKYTVFNDSVNTVAMKKAIHETEIKYQTTLKEKAISEQKLQLVNKDYELQKKNRYIIIGFSAIFLLVLSGLIIYLAYRNRNQSIELSLLKAQIHPHFLFNTLNNLYALSMNKSDEAPGVVMGLSNILRYILYECNTLHADLRKEIDMISEYIKLERIRYTGGLEVNTYFDSDFEGYTVAPLLLLPLVENAYKHGVNKLEGDSWINIEAKIKGDQFIFKISNNKPIAKNQLIPKSIYGNIGLKNIKKRLDIIYPKQHRFKIIDSEDIFMVTLELTVKRN